MYCKLKKLPVGTAFRYLQTNWIVAKHCKKSKYVNVVTLDNKGKPYTVEFEGAGSTPSELPCDKIGGNHHYYGYNAVVTIL